MILMGETWYLAAVYMLEYASGLECEIEVISWYGQLGCCLWANFQNLMVILKCYLRYKNEILAAENCDYPFRTFRGYKQAFVCGNEQLWESLL